MAKWTAANIPNQSGKRFIVTGANSGLGYQTSLALAKHGATVVLACRDQAKGAAAMSAIQAQVPYAQVSLASLDLASLASIRQFAEQAGAQPIDVLINNAGVMAIPYRQTADGFEMQFGTNHLGHFVLTGLLWPRLAVTPDARVVTLSSFVHRSGHIDFDDLQGKVNYKPWGAYGQSKLANFLFGLELQRRIEKVGIALKSIVVHPGYAATNLQTVGPQMAGDALQTFFMSVGNRLVAQSDAQGALPSLYAATDPEAKGGQYYGPKGMGGLRGSPQLSRGAPQAYDTAVAQRLWQVSEELTDVHYLD